MTTTMKNEPKSAIKPVGRLDASMLLARKGEATPAVRATSQNNPDLAWSMTTSAATDQTVHPKPENASHTPTEPRAPHRAKPTASARLRPDSFRPPQRHERTPGGPAVGKGGAPIALTLRVDEDVYLRLAYLAECTGFSLTRVLQDALDNHLIQCRVPKAGKLTVRPK